MRRLLPLFILLLPLTLSSTAFAWLSTGHRIIAIIAWDDLSPTARTEISAILKAHPRYKEDLLGGIADDASPQATDLYAFESAATWPDMVRSFSNPMHFAYNHPAWHFIDIPYCVDGQKVPPTPPGPPGPQNILDALNACVAEMKNPKATDTDKSIAICWILHLCGDIAQPLHCCNMYSPQFPSGDKGGNSLIVLRDPPYTDSQANLHFIWDSLPGDFEDRDIEYYIAEGLRNDPRYSRQKLKSLVAITDFTAWANESHALAIKYAYLNGQLSVINTPPADADAGNQIPGLPPGYLKTAEQIGDQRLILAGYRTADLLNSLFPLP